MKLSKQLKVVILASLAIGAGMAAFRLSPDRGDRAPSSLNSVSEERTEAQSKTLHEDLLKAKAYLSPEFKESMRNHVLALRAAHPMATAAAADSQVQPKRVIKTLKTVKARR